MNGINLMTIFGGKGIPTNTRLGQEIFKVVEYFLEKNLFNKTFLAKVQINKEVYLNICSQKPCLTTEMRGCFLGIVEKNVKVPLSADSDLEEEEDYNQRRVVKKVKKEKRPKYVSCMTMNPTPDFEDRSTPCKYLFDKLDLIEDVSHG